MSRLKHKLAALEMKSRVLLAHHGVTPCVPMTILCKQSFESEPDLRLVEPCDTDPATYWTIRLHMAWADEDYAQIARLKRTCPIPKDEYDWGPPSKDGDLTPRRSRSSTSRLWRLRAARVQSGTRWPPRGGGWAGRRRHVRSRHHGASRLHKKPASVRDPRRSPQ